MGKNPIKRKKLPEIDDKEYNPVCRLQETHLRFKIQIGWKQKDGKRYVNQTATTRKQQWLYQYQIKQNIKSHIIREKQKHFIMINVLVHKENITVVNIHAPNNRAPKILEAKADRIRGRNK